MNMTMPNLELTARRARSFFAICDVISDVSKFEKWIARQPKRAKKYFELQVFRAQKLKNFI